MTAGHQKPWLAEDELPAQAEAEAPASANLAPLHTLNATKGGILQAILGEKTLNIGYDVPPQGLVYLTNASDPTLRVPVMIESVETKVPFSQITDEKARAAGYTSRDRMASRLIVNSMNSGGRDGADSNYHRAEVWLNDQSRWSVAKYHLATPEELLAAGANPAEARGTIQKTASTILAQPEEETVQRALAKLNKGEQTIAQDIRRAIAAQFASNQVGAA